MYLNISLLLMPNMFDKQDGHTLDGFSALYIVFFCQCILSNLTCKRNVVLGISLLLFEV